MKGFRDFITRGNLIGLAIAVVIGTAFTAVVTALVADLITPLIAAIGGKPNFAGCLSPSTTARSCTARSSTRVLSFLIIAAVVYFLIVAPMAKLTARLAKAAEVDHEGLPGVPEHHPDRGLAVHVLHRPTRPVNRPPTSARHRAAPASTTPAYSSSQAILAGPEKQKVWTRAGAWPSRVQTILTGADLTGPCSFSLAPLPCRKLWRCWEPDNWLVTASTLVAWRPMRLRAAASPADQEHVAARARGRDR